jgi:hypothetical protein
VSDWLGGVVRDLRALGFFADPARSDAEVVAEVAELLEEGREPAPSDATAELEIARFDEDRVWWADTEADVAAGAKAYVRLVADLARISRGTFRPTRVEEAWADDHGPIRLAIRLPDRILEAAPRYLDDYLDIEGLLPQLNAALPAGGPRFELYTPFDQTAAIVCVTLDERARLEARGWSFAEASRPRRAPLPG